MPTYRLDIAYDWTRFRGWARQDGLRTVQGEIEGALAQLYGEPALLTVAGRTDAGVHASGQVASFTVAEGPGRHDLRTLMRALNSLTADDVAINAVTEAPEGFSARRDALSRRYRYRLQTSQIRNPFERRYAVHWPYPLDRAALDHCAAMIVGSHDFTAFTPTDTEHVRFERVVLEAVWSEESTEILRFEVEADAFMRSMVRALVGTILEVGSGRREPADFERLLTGRPRAEAGETAPAHGLCLIAVRYQHSPALPARALGCPK